MKNHFVLVALVVVFLMVLTPVAFAQDGAPTFSDVASEHRFYDEIEALAAAGVTEGFLEDDGTRTYRPNGAFTRMAAAAFLDRAFNLEEELTDFVLPESPTFSDVAVDHRFFPEIERLYAAGITAGFTESDGSRTYRPNGAFTRMAAAAFLDRAFNLEEELTDFVLPESPTFSDVAVDHRFFPEIERLYAAGITAGFTEDDGSRTYRPVVAFTRMAAAAFLYRGLGLDEPADLTESQEVAAQMNELFYGNQTVNDFYSERTSQMSNTGLGASIAVLSLSYTDIPQEFIDPLPADGKVAAPAGACPAAAEPAIQFVTDGEDVVDQAYIQGKKVIPPAVIMGAPEDTDSLVNKIQQLLQSIDPPALADPEGWNTLFWDELRGMQEQVESLLDYHFWVIAEDIEELVIDEIEQRLEAALIPDEQKTIVLEAFANSNQSGWLSNEAAIETDAFARMDIVAEMTGNISGTVNERREFSIPGAGTDPVFGIQTGEGTIQFEHDQLGLLTFEVEIELDEFDDKGRAIAGTVKTVGVGNDYSCTFIFKADGTREGDLYLNGDLVGTLTMTVDHDKFENYVDLETGDTIDLPDPSEGF